MCIEAVLGHEGVVGALFDDFAVPHHKNLVGAADGGESMGYDEAGAAFHEFGEGGLDSQFGAGIDGAGGFVQDEHGRQGPA